MHARKFIPPHLPREGKRPSGNERVAPELHEVVNRRSTVEGSGDRGYARRLAVALALACGLHATLAALVPRRPPAPPQERVVAQQTITVARRPRPSPKPTPQPTPLPTPRITPAPHYTLAPQTVVRAPAPRAAATPHASVGGAAAHRRTVHRTVASQTAPPQSLAEGTHAGQQNGGAGTGAGPGTGTSGLGGTGSGTGGTGNGNGGETNSSPCGAVYLEPAELSYRHDGTVVQHVVAKIVLGDGTVEVGRFPYPFLYPAERLNPFVHDEVLRPDKGIPVQLPPPGTDMSGAPMAVQIALKYTNPDTGTTTLRDCAAASPAP
jgi:hypothetical protein